MRPRRLLPSLSLLLAFEAVVETGSVTGAARALNLTQSTVSRLIRSLEEQLGQTLFLRRRKRLIPTEAALAYRVDVSRALNLVQRASMSVVANPGGGTLALAILPTFGTRWLAPRLGGFFDAHPGIAMTLATRVQRFSFDREPFDATIFFGDPDWPGAEHLKLFDECYTACAAPALLQRHPVAGPGDMAGLPLLQLESRPDAWADWFAGQGGVPPERGGMVMDQFSMMIQAAISGLGVALLPDYLAVPEIAEGRLASVLRPAVPGSGSYWLAWPEQKAQVRPIAVFRAWLVGQAIVPREIAV